jgi:(2Fe-2S) ferredoxin
MKFEKHIFICTNQRPEGEKKSCGEACGLELVKEFKKQMKELNLNGRMRAQKSGCLDACEYGPSVVVYPEGVFYGGVTPKDVTEIVNDHLLNNRPVKRLIIDFNEKTVEK